MAKYLLLMRHAKSDWNTAGLADKDRPLNPRGRASAPIMANWLSQQNRLPCSILCSSAVRTQQTLELMTLHWTSMKASNAALSLPEIHIRDSLYLASEAHLLSSAQDWIAERPSSEDRDTRNCVMILAHNPGLENLVSQLSDRQLKMPTGAIAVFESSDAEGNWPLDWGNGKMWKLRELAKPRELDLEAI